MSDVPQQEAVPVQFGTTATVPETPTEIVPSGALEPTPVVDGDIEGQEMEQDVPADLKYDHQSILIGLLTDLEGMLNMAKSEIHTVVTRWKAEFDNL